MLCKLGPVWGQRWDGSSESFTVYKSAQDVKAVLCLPLCLPLQAFPLILGVLFKKAPKCSVSENETLSSHKAGRCISPGEDPESVEKQALVFKLPCGAFLGVMEALEGVFTSTLGASLTVFPPQSPGGGQGRCPQAARGRYANTLENTVALENLSS